MDTNTATTGSQAEFITFYDILLDPAAYPTSPNPWKTRYALNFAGVRYRTTWVPLSDVTKTRNELKLAANRKHPNGKEFPTLPIIRDPMATGASGEEVVVGDSFDIALHLQQTYLSASTPVADTTTTSNGTSASLATPALFPPSTVALHRAFNKHVDALFSIHGAPLAGFFMPFDPRTAASDKADMVSRFPGMTKWEDFEVPLGSDRRREMLRAFEEALDVGLAPCFAAPGAGEGPFMDGATMPTYADFIVGGWLQFIRGCLPEWQDMKGWSGGRWAALIDALEPWARVDGRDGVTRIGA